MQDADQIDRQIDKYFIYPLGEIQVILVFLLMCAHL